MNASPRRLTLQRISFKGEKNGPVTQGPFEFDWKGLEKGMYAVLSDKNLKGKSSIFHIARWLLRGEPPSGLQADVLSWVKEALLRFSLDDHQYEVCLQAADGITGKLAKVTGDKCAEIACFKDGAEFSATMATFFMAELGLEPIASWREDTGEAVTHNWSALSGALTIGPKFQSLLGDIAMAGLPTRLLQMYLGLPWVSTLCTAKVAKSSVEREETERKHRRQERDAIQSARTMAIEAQLRDVKAQLANLPDTRTDRARLLRLDGLLLNTGSRCRETEYRLQELVQIQKRLEAAAADDKRRLQEIIDTEEAGKVFRALDPQCCPRCETAISNERRKRERQEQACSVCGELVQDGEDDTQAKEIAEAQCASSKSALDQHRQRIEHQRDALENARWEFSQLEDERQRLEASLRASHRRNELELQVIRLEARLDEAKTTPPDYGVGADADAAIISAAVDETELRVKEKQESLLKEVSNSIVKYAVRFGMTQLTQATLRGNASLSLVKGGITTSFTHVTAGEQLRLKIATIIAILKLGEKHELGRHPGLLFVDSPGAEELAGDNLEDLIKELKGVAAELGHLQIFVAAIASPPVLAHVEKSRLRRAEGDAWVW